MMESGRPSADQRNYPDIITQEPIFEIITKRLREDIIRGVYPPGIPLRMQDVASKFGTSLMPVREAFHRLASEALLVMHPRRGVTVCEMDGQKIKNVYETLGLLSGFAAKMATPNVGPDEIEALKHLASEMEHETADPQRVDLERALKLNEEFHQIIYQHYDNEYFFKTIRIFENFARLIRHQHPFSAYRLNKANEEHRELIALIAQRDAAKVEQLMRAHTQSTLEDLQHIIEKAD